MASNICQARFPTRIETHSSEPPYLEWNSTP